MLVFVNLYLILHFASVFATMVFKWPSQTITVLTDTRHNLIHSAAKFGFYLGISDAPSNANFWMWCHITVICFLITNMALKTTLWCFLFCLISFIWLKGPKLMMRTIERKATITAPLLKWWTLVYLYLKYNPNVLLYLYCGEERDKSHNQSYFSLEVLQKLRWSLLYLACGWFEGRGHYSATKYFIQIWTRGLNGWVLLANKTSEFCHVQFKQWATIAAMFCFSVQTAKI